MICIAYLFKEKAAFELGLKHLGGGLSGKDVAGKEAHHEQRQDAYGCRRYLDNQGFWFNQTPAMIKSVGISVAKIRLDARVRSSSESHGVS